jgi:microcystin-dependent protein
MGQPYVGEIRMFGGNFAPAGWMFCEGQQLPISENETLFQLIGTTYGGDGELYFTLPDLRGRVPVHQGSGFVLAETGGVEEVTLTVNQIPGHNHAALAAAAAVASSPSGHTWARWSDVPYRTEAPTIPMNPAALLPTGGSQPHTNMQPYLAVSFIISLFGLFPSQT